MEEDGVVMVQLEEEEVGAITDQGQEQVIFPFIMAITAITAVTAITIIII